MKISVCAVVLCLLGEWEGVRGKYEEWPGDQEVKVVDDKDAFEDNLSGVVYQAGEDSSGSDDVIWAVNNNPSKLFQLQYNKESELWEPLHEEGTLLRFPDGDGNPDTEDITVAEPTLPNVYACTERNNDDKKSRLSVLLFSDVKSGGKGLQSSELSALQEWDLTDDIKSVDDNEGLEALTWVPDSYLVEHGLKDDSRDGALYDPQNYPNHGSGLFFVGLEDNGKVYVYALTHDDDVLLATGRNATASSASSSPSYTRITSFSSEFDTIMALHFDYFSSSSPAGYLWAVCDNNCKGHSNVFSLVGEDEGGDGHFKVIGSFDRPDDMANVNNEGFTTFPDSRCDIDNSLKGVVWSDDSDTNGHSLRQGTLPCGAFISP